MKKLFFTLLAILIAVPFSTQAVEYKMVNGYTPQQVTNLFVEYGYNPSQSDIDWWGDNYSNQWGSLEQNLQRRFGQNKYIEVTKYSTDVTIDQLGATTPFRPTEFKTTLGQSLVEAHAGTTLIVSSITTKDGNTLSGSVLGNTIVLSLNPGKSNAENVLCTGLTTATKTFTGCTFGQRFDQSGSQASNIKAHAPGEPVIISNTDTYLTAEYPTLDGDNTFNGTNLFTTTTAGSKTKVFFGDTDTYIWMSTSTGQIGFATSTSGELAWNSTGTSFTPIVPLSLIDGDLRLATSTGDFILRDDTDLGINIMTDGGIATSTDGLHIATSTDFVWSGEHSFTATTTMATTTISNLIGINQLQKSFTAGESITAGNAVIIGDGNPFTFTSFVEADDDGTDIYGATGDEWAAQTFTTTAHTYQIASTTLKIANTDGSAHNVTVSIRATTAGVPSGSDLQSETKTVSVVNGTAVYTFAFDTAITVSPSTVYAIVARADGDGGNSVSWRRKGAGGYTGGAAYASSNSGSSWSATGSADLYFLIDQSVTEGSIYITEADNDDIFANNFIGFANESVSVGESCYVILQGVDDNQSGLSTGSTYYLSDTAGAIATSAGSQSRLIGRALSSTEVKIINDF